MLLPKQRHKRKGSEEEQRLLKLFSALDAQDRASLLAFAEFLLHRSDSVAEEGMEVVSLEPKSIPRPEEESVVAAIKRLSESYHMLEKSALLTETSSLMTEHVMRGRSASEVIDELEALFRRHHQALVTKQDEQ